MSASSADVGVRAAALHGGKTQRVRTRTLAEFREGRFGVLIATNVAARGIHVDGVSLVVHVDPPADAKDYLHRAGRTARAGEKGTVVTLVLPRQRRSTFTMLEKAGVDAARTPVTPDAPELAEVTGARTPSGVPVPPEPVESSRGHRPATTAHATAAARVPPTRACQPAVRAARAARDALTSRARASTGPAPSTVPGPQPGSRPGVATRTGASSADRLAAIDRVRLARSPAPERH